MRDIDDYIEIVRKSFEKHRMSDPFSRTKRREKLIMATKVVERMFKEDKPAHYSAYLNSMVSCIVEDEFAEKFDNLDERAIQIYKETSEEYQELLKKWKN